MWEELMAIKEKGDEVAYRAALLDTLQRFMHKGQLVKAEGAQVLINGIRLNCVKVAMSNSLGFVFYELAFALGYRPELASAVHASVAAQHAAWAAAA